MVASASAGWYRTEAQGLKKELTRSKEVVGQLEATITRQNELAISQYEAYQEQTIINDALVRESNAKTKVINKYKTREHVVYAKPALVERLEQKALNDFFEEVSSVE